jgi:ABC-type branched-subunit amino acid transport system ATPase component
VRAVDDVSFEVEVASFVGLIGPNGAGKTTLIDAVCGFCAAEGEFTFAGHRIDGIRAFRRARLGLARTFQAGELFDDLTVLENVLVGSYKGSFQGAAREIVRCRQRRPSEAVLQALDMFGLLEVAETEVQELSVGIRKLVTVARALASSPRLVLLDEPAAGLDSTESLQLGESLRALPRSGVSVVLVDHDIDLVLSVCEQIIVLDNGRLIASGTGAEIQSDQNVREAYLGAVEVGGK